MLLLTEIPMCTAPDCLDTDAPGRCLLCNATHSIADMDFA